MRLAKKYLGDSCLFDELEGVPRLKRTEHHIRRKARIRLRTPIACCWVEDWVAGDIMPDLKKRIDGKWALQAFYDAEAAGLIEFNPLTGEYEDLTKTEEDNN
jgi:hypothetical protein